MQCKDIPDRPVLLRLRDFRPAGGHWATSAEVWFTLWDTDGRLDAMPTLVPAFPPGCPWKLMNAKMASLKRRGLVQGCECGCRGDWHITDNGRAFLPVGEAGPT